MKEICGPLRELFEREQVDYTLVPHHADHTAYQTAWDTHTPSHSFAKSVFVRTEKGLVLVVLPADDRVSETKLRLALGAEYVEIASETEIAEVCPECEVGAAPPFGNLWGLEVFVNTALAESETITFNAGTHRTAVRMGYADWAGLTTPRVIPLGRHD
ncbi:MAG: YbaK/EbsC family protein [bacterium]|nr:YbaK/EbsC family protein [bacterium]